jgi:hypothetical protein
MVVTGIVICSDPLPNESTTVDPTCGFDPGAVLNVTVTSSPGLQPRSVTPVVLPTTRFQNCRVILGEVLNIDAATVPLF